MLPEIKIIARSALQFLMALLPAIPAAVHAQVSPGDTTYLQTFDSLSAFMPDGWSVDTGATATYPGYDVATSFFYKTPAANTAWSNTTGHFKNVASGTPYSSYAGGGNAASQVAQANRALGIRQTAATDARTAFVFRIPNTIGLTQFRLSFSLQSLDSTAGRTSTWQVDYGTGAMPSSFVTVTATGNTTTGGHHFSKENIQVDFANALDNKAGPVWIRIASLSATTGSGSRATTAIDDYHLTWDNAGAVSYIPVLSKTPEGPGIAPSLHELQLKLGRSVQPGSGQISLYQEGNPTPAMFDVTGSEVVINDSTVTIANVTLQNNKTYHVLFPAGCFTDSISGLSNLAVTDTAWWTFATADTLPPQPVQMLDETFSTCSDTRLGSFIQYNIKGAQAWHCTTDGHNDNNSVSINGGTAAGSSELNEDWLISADALDFSAMTSPVLSFWQKRAFEGNTTRSVRISITYHPGMSPAEASWKTLPAGLDALPEEDAWTQVGDIGLNAYKNTPFYLAFTYTCGSNGAYELSYDDIKVTEQPLRLQSPEKTPLQAAVLGTPATGLISLGLQLETGSRLTIVVYNLDGQVICKRNMQGRQGYNTIAVGDRYFAPGLYFIKIAAGSSMLTLKAAVP